jgi:hypothetical protein
MSGDWISIGTPPCARTFAVSVASWAARTMDSPRPWWSSTLGRGAGGRALDERIERAAGQLSGPVAQHLPAVPVDPFQSTTPFKQLLERLRMTIGRTTFHLAFRALGRADPGPDGRRAGHVHRPRVAEGDLHAGDQLAHRIDGDRGTAATQCLPRIAFDVAHARLHPLPRSPDLRPDPRRQCQPPCRKWLL